MKQKITIAVYDGYCDDDNQWEMVEKEIEHSDLDVLAKITRKDILKHLSRCIGKMTPGGETKFIDYMEIGNVALSMQLSYQLYCLRDNYLGMRRYGTSEFVRKNDERYNEPITEKEFDKLTENDNCRMDIFIAIDGHGFQCGEVSIKGLVSILNVLGERHLICDDGLYDVKSIVWEDSKEQTCLTK
ncbi:MAG: hypothetical protein MR717_09005 [Prevotella sp.]|nr:hypothetical protein [Prevotella sp.]